MKKIISLILAVVMVMAMAISVSAAEASHNHTRGELISSGTTYRCEDDGLCYKVSVKTYKCGICSDTFTEEISTNVSHNRTLDSASCNGYVQFLYYRCRNCHTVWDDDQRDCPGVGLSHNGGCRWLPV